MPPIAAAAAAAASHTNPYPKAMSERPFSTAAKVYPSHLPQMHHLQQQTPRRMPSKKWLPSIAAVAITGYGVQAYYNYAAQTREAEAQALQRREAERRRQNEAMMDEYGGRETLEELERAVQFYEKK